MHIIVSKSDYDWNYVLGSFSSYSDAFNAAVQDNLWTDTSFITTFDFYTGKLVTSLKNSFFKKDTEVKYRKGTEGIKAYPIESYRFFNVATADSSLYLSRYPLSCQVIFKTNGDEHNITAFLKMEATLYFHLMDKVLDKEKYKRILNGFYHRNGESLEKTLLDFSNRWAELLNIQVLKTYSDKDEAISLADYLASI